MRQSPSSLQAASLPALPAGLLRTLDAARLWDLLAVGALLLLPLLVYWPAIVHPYEMRDGYSVLREAHEEPGKIVGFCASHARPLYGWLLDVSYRQIRGMGDLHWIRLLATLLIGLVSLATFRGLRLLGWSFACSLLVGLWVGLVPPAQVVAGWSIGWPYAVAVLLALIAFFAVENALPLRPPRAASALRLGGAWICLVASLLIYQPSALFYAVPLAAAFLVRRHRPLRELAGWAAFHGGLLLAAMATAYGLMSWLYADGVFVRSARVHFETDWAGKLLWFLREPLPNSLSLLAVNDEARRWRPAYAGGVAAAGLVLAAGALLEGIRHGWRHALLWLAGLGALALLAFALSLLAAERYATYRTAWALTGVVLVFLVAAGRAILASAGRRAALAVGLVALGAAALRARTQTLDLIAQPQGNEWSLIAEGARRADIASGRPQVFVLIPSPADISTDLIYHDEFGSLSSNSEWVPKEMFRRAMRDLHPHELDIDRRYLFASGPALPATGRFDVIIDMRDLRHLRPAG